MVEFISGFLAGAIICTILAIFLFKYLLKQGQIGLSDTLEKGEHRLSEISSELLGHVLLPLKEKLSDYQKSVEATYSKEARERFSLQKQVDLLMQSNELISKEASNLTRALKGDVKIQGIWGETILENILESSGLEENREFFLQAKGLALKDSEGQASRPDVVVKLPNESFVIIDSKVSLTHFMKLMEGPEDYESTLLKDLKNSMKTHIDGLSNKNYQNLEGLKTPDFVFMFIPIEAALSWVLKAFPDLLEYAWKKNVVIATPSTLMSSLRTISSIWRLEKQSQNAEEIAKKGGLLYDKFVGLYQDLTKVGESLDKTKKNYDLALNKLHSGKNSLFDRAQELKDLGVKSTKSIH